MCAPGSAARVKLGMKKLLRYALWLWCLPLTLLGLPLWLLATFFKPKQALAGVFIAQSARVFIAYSPLIDWLLKHHPFGPMQAMALGCCVLARDAHTLRQCMAHELVHVEQALRWGPLFPLAYACCSAGAWRRGECPYAGNRFECEAFAADNLPDQKIYIS
jgi:hypothetical protein